jgi:hypothetical protein
VDFDQYVAARYGRLIEHAVLLGCAEGEAGTHVDQVLLTQRKNIRRAEDPDPLVHEALERSIRGAPPRPSRTGPLVGIALVAVAVAVGVALTYRPPPEPMPSLFALDGGQAQRLLEDQGFDVQLRPARACEPQGLVLGSDPPAGQLVRKGATVTVRTAVPSDVFCEAQYVARSDAWEFVAFALGGTAPEFADTVRLVVDGGPAIVLDHDEAVGGDQWRAAFDLLAKAAHQAAPTTNGMPALRVDATIPPEQWCGVLRPAATGRRFALRLEIDPRGARDVRGCPLTVDLYRSERVIDTVVLYTAKELGESGPVVDPAGLRPTGMTP